MVDVALKVVGFLLLVALILAFIPFSWWLFMVCWNYIAPMFGGPVIGFWHAAAICVILSFVGGVFKVSSSK